MFDIIILDYYKINCTFTSIIPTLIKTLSIVKKIFYLLICSCFCFQLSVANAQIGNLKNKVSNASKEAVKSKKSNKTEETKEVNTPSETKEVNTPSETKDAKTTSSITSPSVDFRELESKKMEWTSTFERLEKQWDRIPYEEYIALKKEYEKFYVEFSPAYQKANGKEHQDSYTQKLILKNDASYTEKATFEQMDGLKNKVKRSFDDKDWTVYPSDRVSDIETAERMIDNIKVYLKNQDSELLEFEKSLKAQKDKIIEYVASGGLEKRDAEVEKRMIETRTLHSAGMSDASVNSTVASEIDKQKYGTPVKTVITSKSWEIERNDYGHIKLKFVKVDIATKKADGKCYFIKGSVARKHEGGGQYGNQYLNIYYTEGQMNCNNVSK